MKLISKIKEVQENVPVSMTQSIEVLKSFLTSAENQFIKTMIGKAQFDALADAYSLAGHDLVAVADLVMREALEISQRVISNLGYLVGLPVLNVTIGASGVQIFSNENTKSAFQWQVEDLKRSLLEIGFDAIEDLMDHLESNLDVFVDYALSAEFRRVEDNLIENARDFNIHYNIRQSRYAFQTMTYIMSRIEKQDVAPLFGKEFFNNLKNDDLEGKALELVEDYLKPGIALLTVSKALVERIIVIDNGVASVNLGANYESIKDNSAALRDSVKEAAAQLTQDGNRFIQTGLEFAILNAAAISGYQLQPVIRARFKAKNDPAKGIFTI